MIGCGRRDLGRLAGATGLATLLAASGIAVAIFDSATAVAVAGLLLLIVALATLVWRRPSDLAAQAGGIPAAALAILFASIPFMVAGGVGILGVGLVNDDMASHLLLAAWLDEGFSPEPVLIDQGYPLGPHALVAGLERLLGSDEIDLFAGLILAIPALTALLAFGALSDLGPLARTLAAAAVALPYLVVAYLAQEAFKEPIMAFFLLAFALALPTVRRARDAIPLGVIAAGAIYVYSFPGLVWLVAAAIVWGAIELVRTPERRANTWSLGRAAIAPAALAAGVALALAAPDLGRILDFADFRALDPERANEGGLGNLRGHISPLEALGIWPTSEFRLAAGAGSLPAAAFYAGAALGLLALAVGLPGWMRRYGVGVPAALVGAVAVFIAARALGTVYTSAKALAIVAPLVAIVALGGLLAVRSGWRTALAAAFLAGAALSSFLVLRQAPVGPSDHGDELAEIRPLVAGEKLLFLGRDNFVLYELRGSKPFTHVRNFYDPYFVKPNFELRDVGSKFDFDSVEARKLVRFPYVLTTRAAYASGPPPGYEAVRTTPSYILWARGGDAVSREPGEMGAEPTGKLDCADEKRATLGRVAFAAQPGIRAAAGEWSRNTVEDGAPATLSLHLPSGHWLLSMRYDSTRALRLQGSGGLDARLPANLDYRGVAPFWPAGEIESTGSPIEITASVEPPSAVGRLLGASSVAHVGELATSPSAPAVRGAPEGPHPGIGTRLLSAGRFACGQQVDWIEP